MTGKTGRPRGRPRKIETEQPAVAEPGTKAIRLGLKAVMTSKGPSIPGRYSGLCPGKIIDLPAHEADNLVSLGYVTYAD